MVSTPQETLVQFEFGLDFSVWGEKLSFKHDSNPRVNHL